MFISLPTIEADVDRLIADTRYNDALANMVVGVHNHYKAPEVAHHALYYPAFDRQIAQLSDRLAASTPPSVERPASRNTLIIATELYQMGGHSRVVEDFARELESPTIVLTDLFSSYRKAPDHLNWLHDTYADTPLITLPQRTLWEKCRALLLLTQRLQPRNIFYFSHHQDPIAFIGTLSHRGARKTLVHHADHNPSLGITLPGMGHADFTAELAAVCTRELQVPTKILPLYVPDSGCKAFSAVDADAFSVVTSGTQVKFARSGELALQNIAQAVLSSTRGKFFHIGPLEDDWQAEIRAHLQSQGIDDARFVAVGPVVSLWQALSALDAHVYLGSAPVGGARAAIEAQGCGYPLAYYRVADTSSLVAADSIYADKALDWGTLAELSALLKTMGPQLARLSGQARSFYEQRYSRAEFLRVLAELSSD